MLEYIVTG